VRNILNQPSRPVHQLTVRPEPKGHGLGNQVDGLDNLQGVTDPHCILVEDVITTGTSTAKAVQALEQSGVKVRAVVAVVDREQDSLPALRRLFPGVEVVALTTLSEIRAAL
jgi:orotate phosphoribosyltransferase